MKTPANHPWKQKQSHTKVKALCMACEKEYEKDPDARTKTCSPACYKQYAKVKWTMHTTRGGFR